MSEQPVSATPKENAPANGPLETDAEPWRWCPRCAHELENHKCKLRCPRCHYFMSCSDFD